MANKKSYLGEFEHLVLLSIASLKDQAYGVTLRHHLRDKISREVSIGALYAATERLEQKGLITTFKAGATTERGGKAKRFMSITAEGQQVLYETKSRLETMWQAVTLNKGY